MTMLRRLGQFLVGVAWIYLGMIFACTIAFCAGCVLLLTSPHPQAPPPPPSQPEAIDPIAFEKTMNTLGVLFWLIKTVLKAMFPFLDDRLTP